MPLELWSHACCLFGCGCVIRCFQQLCPLSSQCLREIKCIVLVFASPRSQIGCMQQLTGFETTGPHMVAVAC